MHSTRGRILWGHPRILPPKPALCPNHHQAKQKTWTCGFPLKPGVPLGVWETAFSLKARTWIFSGYVMRHVQGSEQVSPVQAPARRLPGSLFPVEGPGTFRTHTSENIPMCHASVSVVLEAPRQHSQTDLWFLKNRKHCRSVEGGWGCRGRVLGPTSLVQDASYSG